MLGNIIDARLRELGWSPADLARRAKLSHTHVGNMINGRANTKDGVLRRSTPETIDKIANALGLPIRDLRLAAGLAAPEPLDLSTIRQIESYLIEMPEDLVNKVLLIVRAFHNDEIKTKVVEGNPPPPG